MALTADESFEYLSYSQFKCFFFFLALGVGVLIGMLFFTANIKIELLCVISLDFREFVSFFLNYLGGVSSVSGILLPV